MYVLIRVYLSICVCFLQGHCCQECVSVFRRLCETWRLWTLQVHGGQLLL